MSEPKYAHRFPPCPIYDVEGIESWLEELAKQGLILTKGGLFCGFAEFEKVEPKAMRYRLQPWPKKRKLTDDAGPSAEAVELAEEYGWTYLCDMGEYAVFACEDPNARELDTDPQVQAENFRHAYKRKRNTVIGNTVFLLLVLGLICWLGPVSYELSKPVWYIAVTDLVWLVYPFVAFHEMKHLRMLKEKLSLGDPLFRKKDWKKGRYLHWLSAAFSVLLYSALLTGTIVENFVEWEDNYWQPVAEYTGDLPFATMEDLAGGGTLDSRTWATDSNNEIAIRSTLLAETQMRFEQYGDIVQNGKTVVDGALQVNYYDLRTEWLAKALFREILHGATLSNGKYDKYQPLDIPALPVDQAAAYSAPYPILLMQQGTEVIEIQFTQFSQKLAIPLDQWATAMAEAFLE